LIWPIGRVPIGADREGLRLAGERAGEAPELRSIGRHEQEQAPAAADFLDFLGLFDRPQPRVGKRRTSTQ
jgi:hypothetical protein